MNTSDIIDQSLMKMNENLENKNVTDRHSDAEKKALKQENKKQSKLKKLFELLNIHVNLYFADNAQKYETVMNCNVLTEELKHKYLSNCL